MSRHTSRNAVSSTMSSTYISNSSVFMFYVSYQQGSDSNSMRFVNSYIDDHSTT